MEREIPITEIKGLRIGQVEDAAAGTGCTVLVSEQGMCAGLDIRGGGPASRESELLNPLAAVQFVNSVVFSGGSAFGLAAADGVMDYLEERGIGYDVGVTKVPLVVQSSLFDLTVGDMKVRPNRIMGYEAARRALEAPNYQDGNHGAGCGATVGKLAGMASCMKSGIGSYAIELGSLQVGAIMAVNALGDVCDWRTGQIIAGMLAEDGKGFRDSVAFMKGSGIAAHNNRFVGNTTIGAVVTNAAFGKAQLCKIAGMAHDGLARSIRPVHTSADGDSVYALSVGEIITDIDLVGTLAAEVTSEAISRAIASAKSAYGFIAASDLRWL